MRSVAGLGLGVMPHQPARAEQPGRGRQRPAGHLTDGSGSTLRFETGYLELRADGSYYLEVEGEFNGGGVTMSDEGTYDVSGASIDFTPTGDPARMRDGTVSGGSITAETQFGGIPFEIDLEK